MDESKTVIPVGKIETRILLIRGEKVIIDADLAKLYGVPTKRLNEQAKRNKNRFPDDFMFQLSPEEKAEVVANCDHLKNLKYSKTLPNAFTEHGAIMAAGVLNTDRAIEISVFIVRAFVKDRQESNGDLTHFFDPSPCPGHYPGRWATMAAAELMALRTTLRAAFGSRLASLGAARSP